MSPMLALYVVTAQKQLAMDTGYDPRTIRRVELGECCPSAEFMVKKMADDLNLHLEAASQWGKGFKIVIFFPKLRSNGGK